MSVVYLLWNVSTALIVFVSYVPVISTLSFSMLRRNPWRLMTSAVLFTAPICIEVVIRGQARGIERGMTAFVDPDENPPLPPPLLDERDIEFETFVEPDEESVEVVVLDKVVPSSLLETVAVGILEEPSVPFEPAVVGIEELELSLFDSVVVGIEELEMSLFEPVVRGTLEDPSVPFECMVGTREIASSFELITGGMIEIVSAKTLRAGPVTARKTKALRIMLNASIFFIN